MIIATNIGVYEKISEAKYIINSALETVRKISNESIYSEDEEDNPSLNIQKNYRQDAWNEDEVRKRRSTSNGENEKTGNRYLNNTAHTRNRRHIQENRLWEFQDKLEDIRAHSPVGIEVQVSIDLLHIPGPRTLRNLKDSPRSFGQGLSG